MSDTTPATTSASCCTGSATTCPCAARLATVERTVSRIRFWLLVALGVLVLLVGIALGRGGAMKEMRERARGPHDGPRAAAPFPPGMQGPPAMQGGPRPRDGREGRRPGRDRDDGDDD